VLLVIVFIVWCVDHEKDAFVLRLPRMDKNKRIEIIFLTELSLFKR
jgi:hypothetical protein